MSNLRTTPLTPWHRHNGAKLVDFAGFEMPVQYEGIMAEHKHCRTAACVFDICHMGEFFLTGPGAKNALNRLVTQDLDTLSQGKCRYGFLLNESGGVLDDLIIYCLGPDAYMLVVNGACEPSDFAWLSARLAPGPRLENASDRTAKIDLQGPRSLEVLEAVLGAPWRHLKYFSFQETMWAGHHLTVSRTGYTGELGYELYLPADKALPLWEKLVAHPLVKPAGLGARDTLRLECGYPLYGQDLDTEHTPVEAGYGPLLKKESDYVGKSALAAVRTRLVALAIDGRRTCRHHDHVHLQGGPQVGVVTSGSFAPTLGHCVALAYVDAAHADAPAFTVKAARVELPAKRTDLPFFKDGTARMKLE